VRAINDERAIPRVKASRGDLALPFIFFLSHRLGALLSNTYHNVVQLTSLRDFLTATTKACNNYFPKSKPDLPKSFTLQMKQCVLKVAGYMSVVVDISG
jgi:hypothetical protein